MKKKAAALYVRVSTTGQDVASQLPDLKAWAKVHARGRAVTWYRDKFTGTTMQRPGLQTLEADVRAGKVGVVVVWRLDRLGRTAGEMVNFLDELYAAGVGFVSVRDGIDISTASGRLFRTILAGFAEYEHEVISERIKAGVVRAKKKGKTWGGRKEGYRTRLTREKVKAVRALLRVGTKKAAVARQLSISERSVYRALGL